jgi:hypothetical protein
MPDDQPKFHRLAFSALILLTLMLPFEPEMPWLALGPIVLTNVEILLASCLLGTALLWWQQRFAWQRPFPRWWLVLIGWFILVSFLSSVLTAEFRTVALKASLRTTSGVLLALALPQIVRSSRELLWTAIGLVSGGLLAALLGLLEFVPSLSMEWLNFWRDSPTMAGPFLRLTGTFDFANQAAMFIEATLPFLLVLIWLAYRNGRRPLAVGLVILTFIYLEAGFLTFSRASFATIFLVTLALAILLKRGTISLYTHPHGHGEKQQVYLWAGTAGLVLILIPINLLFSPTFQLRLSTEGDNEWYQARVEVPPELQVSINETIQIPVTLINEGALTWENTGSNPVVLSVTWVQPQTNLEWTNRLRWPLPRPLSPGEQLSMEIPVQTPPQEGVYRLKWDLVQDGITWFGSKSEAPASSRVTVGDVTTAVPESTLQLVEPAFFNSPVPDRLTLWQVAWQLLSRHPLLGIGLDNFRLLYGRELGQTGWNETIHSNSWYVETLVSLGLSGSLPFFGWLVLMTLDIWRTLRESPVSIWQTAIAAGILAFFIHGLLDYFLLFNATALLFWILIGLWFSLKNIPKGSQL